MAEINDGGPAFPSTSQWITDDSPGSPYDGTTYGMTRREYFAAHAEPLDERACMDAVAALAGRPRPHDEQFKAFTRGEPGTEITAEQWRDYFRWWGEACVAKRLMHADAMIAAVSKGGGS
jgi:hypothetical protein